MVESKEVDHPLLTVAQLAVFLRSPGRTATSNVAERVAGYNRRLYRKGAAFMVDGPSHTIYLTVSTENLEAAHCGLEQPR